MCRRKKAKKQVETVRPELLGFEAPEYEELEPRPKKVKYVQVDNKRKFNFKVKFRFVVSATEVGTDQLLDGTSWRGWQLTKEVYMTVSEKHPVVCPVCLNTHMQGIKAAQITYCGHVFCFICLLKHMKQSTRPTQCPVCNEWLDIKQLKPCTIFTKNNIQKGEVVELVLRARQPHSFTLYNPQTMEEDLNFSRFIRVQNDKLKERLTTEIKQLMSCQQDAYRQRALQISTQRLSLLDHLSHDKSDKTDKQNQQVLETSKMIQFYQQKYGRMIFLHPICHKYMTKQFKVLPLVLQSIIVSQEDICLDQKHHKRYKYLSHLPQNHDIVFVELDMEQFLDHDNLMQFQDEMGRHKAMILHREEQEMEKMREMSQKAAAKKLKELRKIDRWDSSPNTELPDLKNCNRDQSFPQLVSQSSSSFMSQLESRQEQFVETTNILSELKEEAKQELKEETKQVPEEPIPIIASSISQIHENPSKSKKRKKKQKGTTIDVTSNFFDYQDF